MNSKNVDSNSKNVDSKKFDVDSNSKNVNSNSKLPNITIDPLEIEKIDRNMILQQLYYRPEGYYQSAKKLLGTYIEHSNLKLNNNEKKQLLKDVKTWLEKQVIWQIHSPGPHYIPRASFNQIKTPNDYHQIDTLYLPHDNHRSNSDKSVTVRTIFNIPENMPKAVRIELSVCFRDT